MSSKKYNFIPMLVLGLALSSTANAALIDYSFNGTAGAGSSIDLGAGAIDLSGVSFTATGSVTDDTDLFPVSFFGLFAATTTYDFGAIGSFITDIGAEFYAQGEVSPTDFFIGLTDAGANTGLVVSLSSTFFDVNMPEALGIITPISGVTPITRTQTNAAGSTLLLTDSLFITGANITPASSVPVPETLPLLALGLAALRLRRRA